MRESDRLGGMSGLPSGEGLFSSLGGRRRRNGVVMWTHCCDAESVQISA